MENLLNTFAELMKSGNAGDLLGKLSGSGDNSQIASLLPMLTSLMDNKKSVAVATPENLSKELDILIRSSK